MSFKVAAAPHGHSQKTNQVMAWVVFALIPGVIIQSYFFGWGVWSQILIAVTVAYLSESICVWARERSARQALRDNTALVTAVLLAISIPPLAPWWIIVIGTLFSIVVVKQVYGGMGQNIFNPAMAGYVLLLISFPVQMTHWLPAAPIAPYDLGLWQTLHTIIFEYTPTGYDVEQLRTTVDGMSMATPLDGVKTALDQGKILTEAYQQPMLGSLAGIGWQWLNLGFLLGGIILLQQHIIRWHIPVGLAGLLVPSFLAHMFAPSIIPGPIFHALSGATMLGAFFIATDPVSAATSGSRAVIIWLTHRFIGMGD